MSITREYYKTDCYKRFNMLVETCLIMSQSIEEYNLTLVEIIKQVNVCQLHTPIYNNKILLSLRKIANVSIDKYLLQARPKGYFESNESESCSVKDLFDSIVQIENIITDLSEMENSNRFIN